MKNNYREKLIAVSGGPDSMLLLDMYKSDSIVVAFVNYNIRYDSSVDQKIVEDFCQKYNLPLEKLILEKGISYKGNFQSWARKIRYDFFLKIYEKYECSKLLVAHHKDDFLETAIMQQEKNKIVSFYGIKKNVIFNKMNIERPFIDIYWKNQIMDLLHEKNIAYQLDYSNLDPKYRRNEIRNALKCISLKEKEIKYKEFLFENSNIENNNLKYELDYRNWKTEGFSSSFLDKTYFKKELVYLFLTKHFCDINISKKILDSLILFILSKTNGGKKFKLNNDMFIFKKSNKIIACNYDKI